MRNGISIAALCLLSAVWAGCATHSPRTDFYTLSAMGRTSPASAGYSIAVGPVSVPEIVDRPQIVVRTGPNEVFIDEFHRWGSPLGDGISRAVAENLSAILGTPRVAVFPKGTAAGAKYRAVIDVMAFDSEPGAAAKLDAVWTVRTPGDGTIRSGRTTVRETVPGPGYAALVAAHSRALGKLSGDIAEAIRGMEGD